MQVGLAGPEDVSEGVVGEGVSTAMCGIAGFSIAGRRG